MFCIAAFIVLAILGIFSASHRKLAKQAWHCVLRRVTFKPCDINFSEEVKGRILGKLIIQKPRLAKFLNRWFDWMAFIFVVLTIWSLIAVFFSALNLWVYDTCDPVSGESCSLSGEACGIQKEQITLFEAISQNRIGEWAGESWNTFQETVTRIPDRMKNWKSEDYLASTVTFYYPLDPNKPYAVEAIDPGCKYCKKLFENIKKAEFEKKYNLSYLLYPIPDSESPNGFKFANSYLVASYLEATKSVPLQAVNKPSPDWQILEKIFTEKDTDKVEWQTKFNLMFNATQAEDRLKIMLQEIGYNTNQIQKISELAHSESVKSKLLEQKNIVENILKTVKIPTIVFNGRRFDRVVDVNSLQ